MVESEGDQNYLPKEGEGDKDKVPTTDDPLAADSDLTDPANIDILKQIPQTTETYNFPVIHIVDPTETVPKAASEIDDAQFPEPPESPQGKIETDDQGRVTKVDYPNGDSRSIRYNEAGEIDRVEYKGEVFELKDGKWQSTKSGDLGGNGFGHRAGSLTAEANFGNPKISSEGTFTFEEKDGSRIAVFTDGTQTAFNPDNSTVFTNAEGQVSYVKYGNGDTRSYTYGADGKMSSVIENGVTYGVHNGVLHGPDGKPTSAEGVSVSKDGVYSYLDADGNYVSTQTDRTSTQLGVDGSLIKKDTEGRITDIKYADGKTRRFGYDDQGRLNAITDSDGKVYEFKPTLELQGKRYGAFESADGTKLYSVELDPTGTLRYRSEDGKAHTDYPSGNFTTTTKTVDELFKDAERVHSAMVPDGSNINNVLKGMTPADLAELERSYQERYGTSLYDNLQGKAAAQNGDRQSYQEALVTLSEAHLQTAVLQSFSEPEDIAAATKQIDDFKARAAAQGLTPDQIATAQEKAAKALVESKEPTEFLRIDELEKILTDPAPTMESLAIKYGITYETVDVNGQPVTKSFVSGRNGEKLPVLDNVSQNPVEAQRQLKEWQDKKIAQLQTDYGIIFSTDGDRQHTGLKEIDLRSPRIDELLAFERALQHSEPSTRTLDGNPVRVWFAAEPSSPYDAYVIGHGGEQLIVFEPLDRSFEGLEDTILHEWAHNGQHNMSILDPEASAAFAEAIGYRKVDIINADGNSETQWQFKSDDGKYYAQGPGQAPFGKWTRVDEQGRPLKADGTLAQDWKDKAAESYSNQEMQARAAVKPSSQYFPSPGENGAETLRHFRVDAEGREALYANDPVSYAATKQIDQAELDADPRYGRNEDGSSKYIRLPDGTVAENNDQNRKAVAAYEAALEEKYRNKTPSTPDPTKNPDWSPAAKAIGN